MRKTFHFGTKSIEYQLTHSNRKTLGISVLPDLRVSVVAPLGASPKKIESILLRRAPWILKQQEFFLAFFPKQPAKRFISGETHYYLGRQYRLKVTRGKKESVRLVGRFIHVTCLDRDNVKRLLKNWYLRLAGMRFSLYADDWIERFKRYGVQPRNFIIREMPKRWGSCTAKHNIILNPELIKAPRGCIEYVIMHELCHLVHHNHTQKFVDLQTKMMPSWEKWKMRLEKLMA